MKQVGVDELTRGTRCAKDLVGRDNSGFTVKGLNNEAKTAAAVWNHDHSVFNTALYFTTDILHYMNFQLQYYISLAYWKNINSSSIDLGSLPSLVSESLTHLFLTDKMV